ncbi:acetyl-CoA carboxylase, partial [Paracoccus sanguinis]
MSDTEQTRPHDGDAAFIQALAELLNRNELTELTVKREYGENDKLTVELSKHGKQVIVQAAATPAAPPADPRS